MSEYIVPPGYTNRVLSYSAEDTAELDKQSEERHLYDGTLELLITQCLKDSTRDTYDFIFGYDGYATLCGEEILHLYALVEAAKNHVLARSGSLKIRGE